MLWFILGCTESSLLLLGFSLVVVSQGYSFFALQVRLIEVASLEVKYRL